MEHDELLGGDLGPAASRENLEGVLRRHLRRRRRLTAGVAGAVMALSLGGGAAIGGVLASTGGPVASGAPRGTSRGALPAAAGGHRTPPAPATGTAQLPTSAAPNGLSWTLPASPARQPTSLAPGAPSFG